MAAPADHLSLCAKLIDEQTGEKQLWGDEDFWEITGQSHTGKLMSVQDIKGEPNPGSHWCVDHWEIEGVVHKVGCKNIHLHCAATDMCKVLSDFRDPEAQKEHQRVPPNVLSESGVHKLELPSGIGVTEKCLEQLCPLEYHACIAEHGGERQNAVPDPPAQLALATTVAIPGSAGEATNDMISTSTGVTPAMPKVLRHGDPGVPPVPSDADATMRDVPNYSAGGDWGQHYLSHDEACGVCSGDPLGGALTAVHSWKRCNAGRCGSAERPDQWCWCHTDTDCGVRTPPPPSPPRPPATPPPPQPPSSPPRSPTMEARAVAAARAVSEYDATKRAAREAAKEAELSFPLSTSLIDGNIVSVGFSDGSQRASIDRTGLPEVQHYTDDPTACCSTTVLRDYVQCAAPPGHYDESKQRSARSPPEKPLAKPFPDPRPDGGWVQRADAHEQDTPPAGSSSLAFSMEVADNSSTFNASEYGKRMEAIVAGLLHLNMNISQQRSSTMVTIQREERGGYPGDFTLKVSVDTVDDDIAHRLAIELGLMSSDELEQGLAKVATNASVHGLRVLGKSDPVNRTVNRIMTPGETVKMQNRQARTVKAQQQAAARSATVATSSTDSDQEKMKWVSGGGDCDSACQAKKLRDSQMQNLTVMNVADLASQAASRAASRRTVSETTDASARAANATVINATASLVGDADENTRSDNDSPDAAIARWEARLVKHHLSQKATPPRLRRADRFARLRASGKKAENAITTDELRWHASQRRQL